MAGAISGLTAAGLAAMVASAAIQYKASQDAQDRQQREIQRSLEAQERLQRQAEEKALNTASKFAPEDRKTEQATIEQNITNELMAPVSESQKIRSQQQGTQGNVSDDYTTTKARADVNAIKNAETLARLLGKTTSSNRLRMNEGIRLMDTGQEIDQLNNFSQGQQRADSIAIQRAGNVNPGMVFAGQLLGAAGSAGVAYGAGSAGKVTDSATSMANNSADPIGSLNGSMGWTGANSGFSLGKYVPFATAFMSKGK